MALHRISPDSYTRAPEMMAAPQDDWRPATGMVGVARALLAVQEPEAAVRCLACAHRCLIRPGRRGICGVRENRDGSLVTLVYGAAVAAALEPIEKKPLFHAFPGSLAYSIATVGCNFHCRFCQNWEISQAARDHREVPAITLPPEEVVLQAVAGGARSIAYTYVEPTIFIEYVVDTARLARAAGLANLLVTNGYQTMEALDLLAPLIDAANVDLKSFSDGFYRRVCGARLAPVLEALRGMRERGIWVEVTTLLIPGLNDAPCELVRLSRWIASELGPETPWHVSRFYPAYRMSDVPITALATIQAAAEIGRSQGLRHVYPGNVAGLPEETRCPACDELLLSRTGSALVTNRLRHGGCPACGRALAGIGLAEATASPSASEAS